MNLSPRPCRASSAASSRERVPRPASAAPSPVLRAADAFASPGRARGSRGHCPPLPAPDPYREEEPNPETAPWQFWTQAQLAALCDPETLARPSMRLCVGPRGETATGSPAGPVTQGSVVVPLRVGWPGVRGGDGAFAACSSRGVQVPALCILRHAGADAFRGKGSAFALAVRKATPGRSCCLPPRPEGLGDLRGPLALLPAPLSHTASMNAWCVCQCTVCQCTQCVHLVRCVSLSSQVAPASWPSPRTRVAGGSMDPPLPIPRSTQPSARS